MTHMRSARYHPQTQGKIERYHRSLKNVINLEQHYLPGALQQEIARFVEYYNHQQYHGSLNNLTPVDVYNGLTRERLAMRGKIKRETMQIRRTDNLGKGRAKKQLQFIRSAP